MFDPCHKWLGIPRSCRPPTYYQLLGIAPDEDDPDVIEAAAVRQSAYVRNFQTGPHASDCGRLLGELALARGTLLDPRKRAAYDARLGGSPGDSPSGAGGVEGREEGRPRRDSQLARVEVGKTGGIALRSGQPRRRRRPSAFFLLASVVLCAVAGWVFVAPWSRSTSLWAWKRDVGPDGPSATPNGPDRLGEKSTTKSPADVHLDRSRDFIEKRDLGKAIFELTEAIRVDPKSAEAHECRGWCRRQRMELDQAIADFTRAIELGSRGAHAQRGDAYFHKADNDRALADLDKATRLDPRNDFACWVKSRVMASKGDHRAEIAYLDQANAIAPQSRYWIARGRAFERLNDRGKALESFVQALRVDPGSFVGLRVVVSIDGSDQLYFNDSGARWVHRAWSWPNEVRLIEVGYFPKENGPVAIGRTDKPDEVVLRETAWHPERTPVLKNEGASKFLDRAVNLKDARLIINEARDLTGMGSTNDGLVLCFSDEGDGASVFDVTIQFGPQLPRSAPSR